VLREHNTRPAPPAQLVELPPAPRDRGAAASAESPLLLRVEQVAALLNLSRSGVYELIRSGALPSLLVGHRRRLVRTEVEAWVEREAQRERQP
jgi:excisionase family DNA binding protein